MNKDAPPAFRFAPSPNGELHLGHAYSALTTHRLSQKTGGRFLLRLENIDIARCRPEFETGIFEDLAWLGLQWELPVRRQAGHFADYQSALARLHDLGVIYPCFASRNDIAALGRMTVLAADPDGAPALSRAMLAALNEESQRRIEQGEPYNLRLDMNRALALAAAKGLPAIRFRAFDTAFHVVEHPARPERWGDVVLARKDVPASYHLSVVIDDAIQGITHVTRGQDLLAATDVHRLLQTLLDLPEPLYHHHALVRDGAGRKLSKSEKATGLRALREAGVASAELLAWFENRTGPFAHCW